MLDASLHKRRSLTNSHHLIYFALKSLLSTQLVLQTTAKEKQPGPLVTQALTTRLVKAQARAAQRAPYTAHSCIPTGLISQPESHDEFALHRYMSIEPVLVQSLTY